MEQNQKGIHKAARKIIGKEERPQRNNQFDEECQIKIEDNNESLQEND